MLSLLVQTSLTRAYRNDLTAQEGCVCVCMYLCMRRRDGRRCGHGLVEQCSMFSCIPVHHVPCHMHSCPPTNIMLPPTPPPSLLSSPFCVWDDRDKCADGMGMVWRLQSQGVKKIRLTGGEPLVRRGVVDLVGTSCWLAVCLGIHDGTRVSPKCCMSIL